MSYTALTTASAIEQYFSNITFSTATKPTAAAVSAWIDEGTAIIYSSISRSYALPITDSNDLKVLKSLCEKYVITNVNFVLGKNTTNIASGQVLIPKTINHKEFYDTLEKIQNGEIVLVNSAGTSVKMNAYSYNITSTNTVFVSSKDETQW